MGGLINLVQGSGELTASHVHLNLSSRSNDIKKHGHAQNMRHSCCWSCPLAAPCVAAVEAKLGSIYLLASGSSDARDITGSMTSYFPLRQMAEKRQVIFLKTFEFRVTVVEQRAAKRLL